jgi:hypothetical protein
MRTPPLSRALRGREHGRREFSNAILPKKWSSSTMLPPPFWSVRGKDRGISECRHKHPERNFTPLEIINLMDEHLAYEVRGHDEQRIASQPAPSDIDISPPRCPPASAMS